MFYRQAEIKSTPAAVRIEEYGAYSLVAFTRIFFVFSILPLDSVSRRSPIKSMSLRVRKVVRGFDYKSSNRCFGVCFWFWYRAYRNNTRYISAEKTPVFHS